MAQTSKMAENRSWNIYEHLIVIGKTGALFPDSSGPPSAVSL